MKTVLSYLLMGALLFVIRQESFCQATLISDSASEISNQHQLVISGYVQPQFQLAAQKGIHSYQGGDFGAEVNNRFMLRRARAKVEYHLLSNNRKPSADFVFQLNGTEQGVSIKDVFGRINENHLKMFSLSIGVFPLPFGNELTLSSMSRESPERGRMSQILLKGERDLGAMISFGPRSKSHLLKNWRWDVGIFNGTGVFSDIDSRKNFVSRLYHLPAKIGKETFLSGGISVYHGGMLQNTKYRYRVASQNEIKLFVVDSANGNIGKSAPKNHFGADVQWVWNGKRGSTEIRAEYIFGTQTGTEVSSETPLALLIGDEGHYIRKFNGGYFYLIQDIFSSRHQLVLKYDWYDPNTHVKGRNIGGVGSNFTAADVRYSTFGGGFIFGISSNVKCLLWYDHVVNEKTLLNDLRKDIKDDVFTLRLQVEF